MGLNNKHLIKNSEFILLLTNTSSYMLHFCMGTNILVLLTSVFVESPLLILVTFVVIVYYHYVCLIRYIDNIIKCLSVVNRYKLKFFCNELDVDDIEFDRFICIMCNNLIKFSLVVIALVGSLLSTYFYVYIRLSVM